MPGKIEQIWTESNNVQKSRTNLFKVKLCPVKSNNVRYNRTKSSNVAYIESKHKGKLTETKFKTLNRLKKKQTSCSSSSKTKKKTFLWYELKIIQKKNLFDGESNPGLQRDRLGY